MIGKIAAIIPIHGRIHQLEGCITSLLSGSRVPDEIIIVSDGNTLADLMCIQTYARVCGAKVCVHKEKKGAAAARNTGARVTEAELLFFCDADVTIFRNTLDYLEGALEKNQTASFAYGDFLFGNTRMYGKPFDREKLEQENFISTMSLIRHKNFLQFDETLTRFQDWDLWLTLAERGEIGEYVPEILFRASMNGGMSSFIPSIVAQNARLFQWIPRVRAYTDARKKILKKHGIR